MFAKQVADWENRVAHNTILIAEDNNALKIIETNRCYLVRFSTVALA
jgi:hypothetical protein